MSESKEMLLATHAPGAPWPSCPMTGAPFVGVDVEVTRERQSVPYGPPQEPQRTVVLEWDDWGAAIETRERSDVELAEAMAAHEIAYAKWQKSGGRLYSTGQTTTRFTFTTEDGTKTEGMWTGGEWQWLRSWGPDRPPGHA